MYAAEFSDDKIILVAVEERGDSREPFFMVLN